jgi:pimeloyl-ACP methyl ester carboxylesterase
VKRLSVARPLAFLALEGQRAFAEWLSYFPAARLLERAPRGDGHPVLVLPGFMASDESTGILRRYLKRLGYASHPWLLGRNLGAPNFVRERLVDRAAELYARYERKISIVGWSLGGIYAREIAKLMPTRVRQVITLGSPFGDVSRPTSLCAFPAPPAAPASEMPIGRRIRARASSPPRSTAERRHAHWRVCCEDDGRAARNRGHRQPLRPG